ncbi:MAG: Spy/CpxP family protein refolding chaperone, partial [Betaproteobacteria bacterium]|nr:Spy/CpxP family protein refolding chaperone [Betaproteobacteria bacterium]
AGGHRGGPMHGGCGASQAGFAHSGMDMGGGMARYLKRLNLSEAQRDQVFTIMNTQAPTQRDNMKAVQKAQSDLRDLTTAANFDEATAKQLAGAAGAAMGEMALSRAKTTRQIYDVLTPEQRQKLAEMKAQWTRQRADGTRSKWRGDGPCWMDGDAPRPQRAS